MNAARSSWSIDSSTSISVIALLGRAVERVLDRLAQLVDELRVAVEERDAAGEHLGRDDRAAVLLARPSRRR